VQLLPKIFSRNVPVYVTACFMLEDGATYYKLSSDAKVNKFFAILVSFTHAILPHNFLQTTVVGTDFFISITNYDLDFGF
jgi:hypothetical protein